MIAFPPDGDHPLYFCGFLPIICLRPGDHLTNQMIGDHPTLAARLVTGARPSHCRVAYFPWCNGAVSIRPYWVK
jgi:hypothetical protein